MLAHRARMLRDALAAGFVGYLSVVVIFGTWNVVAGRSPFHTAALLGEALIGGLRDPAALAMAGFLAGSHRALFRTIQGMSGHEGERVG